MKLPTLYKRTRTGAIQFWQVNVWTTTHMVPDDRNTIQKTSGQLGTDKPLIHDELIREGKQKRSAKEQAEFQAQSDWKKKKDEGYVEYADVMVGTTGGERFAYENVTDVATIKEDLEHCMPIHNTDAAGNVKPMLAKDWKKVKNIVYPCFIQPKLDGVRCLLIVKSVGYLKDITFLSRSGKAYTTLPHIEKAVSAAMGGVDTEFILDGEIYSDELTFQEITSAVKAQKPNSEKLHFRVYDIVNSFAQTDRIDHFEHYVKKFNSPFITAVETVKVINEDQVKQLHDVWVQRGYEGAMLRMTEGRYDQGQRSSSLLKVKEFDSHEFTFECMEQGQREEDLIAVCRLEDGRKFRAKLVGNKAYKQQLQSECGELQETPITIKHFGYTSDGFPRFPIGVSFRNYE